MTDIDMRLASEHIMDAIDSIKGQNTVLVSEMIDHLLDILNAVKRTEEASSRALQLFFNAKAEVERYHDHYGKFAPGE